MQAYATALLFAIPGFVLLILIEAIYDKWKDKKTVKAMDTISSLSSGMTNTIKDSLGLAVALISYPFFLERMAVIQIGESWQLYAIAFVAMDFASYWSHRLNHSVNIFWNQHAIHHSSEEFNLPCALRQTISNLVTFGAIFLIPAAILGIPSKVIGIIAPLHLFLQFWYHTRHIGKLGILEYIIVTPSQHRVHHAINPIYLDKNLSAIFCIWDRVFGTFQEELDDVPPVYGITRPMASWNPFKINFMHVWLLMKDAWRANSWWDKLRIWFMPLGWRPEDVKEKYPVFKIEDVYNYEKYDSKASKALVNWSWMHLVVANLLLYFMLYQVSQGVEINIPVYGTLIFVSIYGYTALMDRDKYAVWVESIRGFFGFGWILFTGDWFGLNDIFFPATVAVACYFAASALGALYFHRKEIAQKEELGQVLVSNH